MTLTSDSTVHEIDVPLAQKCAILEHYRKLALSQAAEGGS